VSEHEKLALLDQRTRHLEAAVNNLRRYEAAVEQARGHINPEIYGHLRHEVWQAEAAVHALRSAGGGDIPDALPPEKIQQLRIQAQADAIASLARAQGWQWDEGTQHWRTADGTMFSCIGEPL